MSTTEVQDFQKVIDKQRADLARIKSVLDEQSALLQQLKAEYAKLGIDRSKLPALESLPQEYQTQYLAFERELKETGDLLKSQPAKHKAPKMRRAHI